MSRLKSSFEALAERLEQTTTTITRTSSLGLASRGVDELEPPEHLGQYAEQAKTNAIARANLRKFVHDVWEPGYRVEAESEETLQYFEGDQDDLNGSPPEQTPEGGFLDNAFIYSGQKHEEFYHGGKQCTWERWTRGTVLVELLKADPTSDDSIITGFHFIRPETVTPRVQEHTNILLPADPDELPSGVNESSVELTQRGEVAAYVQFDDQSILGRHLGGFDSSVDEITLSQNDVLKFTLEPDIGGDISDGEGVFGTSPFEAISEDIAEYEQIKRDRAEAIARKAYGVWTAQFTPETIDVGNVQEIIEWGDDEISDAESELKNMGPGDVLTSDAGIDLEKHEGTVPDLEGPLAHYVNEITTALPAPKVTASEFDEDVNRDVTGDKIDEYDDLVREERQYQEEKWSDALREIARRQDLDTTGLELKIRPEKSENPVMSLEDDVIGRMNSYITALNEAAGPQAGPTALVSREDLLEVLEFPESEPENPEQIAEEMADGDSEAEAAWRDLWDVPQGESVDAPADGSESIESLATQYSEGDVVQTPQGVGVVSGVWTSSWSSDGTEVEASSSSPAYTVALKDSRVGSEHYKASQLSSGEIETDVDDPVADAEALASILLADESTDWEALNWNNPDSWEDADVPARVIALDAWSSMGGTFRGARQELGSNRLAAAFKDYILQWEGWRR